MELQLHNTLSGEREVFVPLDPNRQTVSFYSCGPTVYDYAHIGNFRSFLNADVLRRTLELLGFEVVHVMNITDVGHMTDDSMADGGGEDKMQLAARRLAEAKEAGTLLEGIDIDPSDPMAIANFYAAAFLEDARMLGLKVVSEQDAHPERIPRPTAYVDHMIKMVESLIDRGHAYVASDGVVYFDVSSWSDYGELSGNRVADLRSGEGGRVDMATQSVKRNPADFMLWKPDGSHLMRWPSPWGEGYPGWHLECSVMARALLGEVIDLHSGGEDNIFPHHECEIAQSRGTTGCDRFARYWFHTRHLMVEGAKMSKSGGNFFTIRDLLQRGASPAAIRLELIRTHYRLNSNFTLQGLRDAQRQIERWDRVRTWLQDHAESLRDESIAPLSSALPMFTAALCEDLNIAGAIGVLNTAIGELSIEEPPPEGKGPGTWADELAALLAMDSVLGVLDLEVCASSRGGLDESKIASLIAARHAARDAGDWGRADELRDQLLDMGIAIKDGAGGTEWERVVQ
ncbi:MAG: cysteine--tRNA ligase [Phycisphaerales bacterium]|nr:cysteine--tRNA ligase [Phycisphaerales bacterium]